MVSGTFRNTKIQAATVATDRRLNTPARPICLLTRGKEYVTRILLHHMAAAQMPMQTPRTLVGKTSEHRMLGTGPNPEIKTSCTDQHFLRQNFVKNGLQIIENDANVQTNDELLDTRHIKY